MTTYPTSKPAESDASLAWLEVVRRKVEALRFGSVQIIVHDGRVTQVESLEKTRFTSGKEDAGH